MTPTDVAPTRPAEGHAAVYGENQPEYLPLPAWCKPAGEVVTRWRLSWRERLAVLRGHDLYLEVLTYGAPLQPVLLTFDEAEALRPELEP